ncbi:propionate--CoA ligase [Luminiphilus syltensis NOR5-1B]|uniref:Propionate--CoA ligase n=1 Tax=Luminiphilus syltensis NOR5-1B TaxID=565045 RepID=B8KS19_9GAMM|nr:AMP-binding protein [Luminiphilus syltensis]EED34170.1 propionate--CoA ligase [Luminiphilus syltensis NOR5-1B]
MTYQSEFSASVTDPDRFWLKQSALVDWYEAPTTGVATDDLGIERWFPDGTLNTCFNAVDRHVASGRGDQVAIYYDSPVTNSKASISYRELLSRVAVFAGALAARGVGKGDRVVIYMPMVPEAAVAMLACARIGAIHSVVFGGFAANELAVRLEDATPKVVVTATCGVEVARVIPYLPIVNEAIDSVENKPSTVIVMERPQAGFDPVAGRDITWEAAVAAAEPADCVPVLATDPLYILYTSGTTGKPKGVVRDNGGHAVALTYSMNAVYDVDPGDVYWAASDIGWVVGHSYIVYAPLFAGCSTIMYEGKPVKTPDAGAFWRLIEEYRVKVLFAAPTAFRAVRKEDPEGQLFNDYDTTSLEALYLAGERLDPPTYHWLDTLTQLPIVDHWWQTETGWAIATNPRGLETLPPKPGSATVPTPGFKVEILDPEGRAMAAGEQGAVVIKRPLPPGCLPTVWGHHERFEQSYLNAYPGYYLSGDGGYLDEDGYLFIMGRTDDVINVAGHRLSTGTLEEVVAAHPAVAECAVIGAADDLKGQVPVGLVVLKDGVAMDLASLERELIADVRSQVGAVASFQRAFLLERLPKTRSGKILRATLRKIIDGEPYSVPSTIEDPAVLEEVAAVIT